MGFDTYDSESHKLQDRTNKLLEQILETLKEQTTLLKSIERWTFTPEERKRRDEMAQYDARQRRPW